MVTTSTLAETRQTFHRPLYRICERWQLPTNCGNASTQRWLWNWWKSIYPVYNRIAKFIIQMESRSRNGWLVRARLPMDKLEILMEIKDWMASTSFLCGENYWKSSEKAVLLHGVTKRLLWCYLLKFPRWFFLQTAMQHRLPVQTHHVCPIESWYLVPQKMATLWFFVSGISNLLLWNMAQEIRSESHRCLWPCWHSG